MLGALYLSSNPPKKVLMLGLGGGTLVRALLDLLPESDFDVVEINPEVIKIAKQYFDFKTNKNTTIFVQDGYDFVQKAKALGATYDLIICDVFSQKYIPPSFLTPEFVQMAKGILSPQGIIAVNTFINSEFAQTKLENSLYKNIFGQFLNVEFMGNRIIFASLESILDSQAIAQNSSIWKTRFEKHGVMTKWLLSIYSKGYKITK
jgi:spermidine synthase